MNKNSILLAGLALTSLSFAAGNAAAESISVSITNNAPSNGIFLTPAWFGFHDGTFDVFSTGSAAGASLESLAEDGSSAALNADFITAQSNGISGSATGGPLAPSTTSSTVFNNLSLSNNSFFSYAAMVLPSNDYFIGNGNPQQWDISSLLNGQTNEISFNVIRVYDAGTELNDFNTSAGNGLFGNVSGGQGGPNQGADESGFVTLVAGTDFLNFANLTNVTNSDVSGFNFDNYQSVATIRLSTVAAVPEPETYAMLLAGLGFIGFTARRKKKAADNT